MPPTSLPLVSAARDALVKVNVTPDEKRRLSALAESQGRSVSELVRLHLPLSPMPPAPPTFKEAGPLVVTLHDD